MLVRLKAQVTQPGRPGHCKQDSYQGMPFRHAACCENSRLLAAEEGPQPPEAKARIPLAGYSTPRRRAL